MKAKVKIVTTMRLPAAAINPQALLGQIVEVFSFSGDARFLVDEIEYDRDRQKEAPGTVTVALISLAADQSLLQIEKGA